MAVDAQLLPKLVEGANNVSDKNCTSIRDRHGDKDTSSYHAHLVQVLDSVFHLLLHLVFQLVEVCAELLPPGDPLFRTRQAFLGVFHRAGQLSPESLCARARLLLEPVKILDAPAELLQAIAFGLAEPLQTFNLALDGICNGIAYKSDDWPHMTYIWATGLSGVTFLVLGLLLSELDRVLAPLDLHVPPFTLLVAAQDSVWVWQHKQPARFPWRGRSRQHLSRLAGAPRFCLHPPASPGVKRGRPVAGRARAKRQRSVPGSIPDLEPTWYL